MAAGSLTVFPTLSLCARSSPKPGFPVQNKVSWSRVIEDTFSERTFEHDKVSLPEKVLMWPFFWQTQEFGFQPVRVLQHAFLMWLPKNLQA